MITIKLRTTEDVYTSVYPYTTIYEIKQNSYPMQWNRGDTIRFIYLGNELFDESTVEQSGLEEGSCIIVQFQRNVDGRNPRRSAPRQMNYQNQRALHIQQNSDEMINMAMDMCTPNCVFMLMGIMLIILWCIRFAFQDLFSKGSDILIGILNILYLIVLIRYFIVQK